MNLRGLWTLMLCLMFATQALGAPVHLGDFPTGAVVHCPWNTAGQDGGATTRSTNGTISVYKGTDTTQNVVGVHDTEDLDSVTGVHVVSINLAGNASFYTAGSEYIIVLSGGVIDTKSVNAALCSFSIERSNSVLAHAKAKPEILPGDSAVKGSTSNIYEVFLRNALTGGGLTGVNSGTSGLTISYSRPDQGNANGTTCSPASMTRGTWTSCGIVAKDETNHPGWYQFGAPDASVATGSTANNDYVVFSFSGVNQMQRTYLPIGLVNHSVTNVFNQIASGPNVNLTTWRGSTPNTLTSGRVPMASFAPRSTALAGFQFVMTDSTNHEPTADLAISCQRSIDGGGFSSGTLTATDSIANGVYSIDFGSGDLAGANIVLRCTAPGADDTIVTITTAP